MKMGPIGPKEKEFYDNLYANVPQEIKSKVERKSGIYGIYRKDTGDILYIGQATNFLVRWVSHKTNALCPDAREYNFHLYDRIRETRASGIELAFAVLEECSPLDLDKKEREWLRKYKPPFNYRLPAFDDSMGWYKRPQLHVTK